MESKKMKRFSIAMMLITFVLMLSMTFLLPTKVFAETETKPAPNSTSDELTLNYAGVDYKIETDDNKEYIIIPTPSAVNEINAEDDLVDGIVATTATAGKVNAKIEQSGSKYKMYLVGNVGDYVVVYTKTKTDKISVSETVNISLERDEASFGWETNSEQIIPSQVNRTAENKIVFPYPFVYVGENSETAKNVADITQKPTDLTGLTITLKDSSAKNIELSKNNETGYYEWTVPTDATVGKYTVKYTFKGDNTNYITKSFNFFVTTSDIETELKISEFASSLPSSMTLFEETTLPEPVVVNTKTNANVDVYTKIYLEFTPSSKNSKDTTDESKYKATTYTNDYSKKDVEGYTYVPSLNEFKFTPEIPGTYTARYVVSDFFGNTAETTSKLNAISSTKTSASGTGFIVKAYDDFAAQREKVDEKAMTLTDVSTAEWMIPSKVKKATVTDGVADKVWSLPAIFGYDKYTQNSSELTYERVITYKKTSTNGTTSVTLTFSSSYSTEQKANAIYTTSGTYKADANAEIPFAFTEIADYEIKYSVKDIFGNNLFNKTYTVNVTDDFADDKAPTVKFENLNSSAVQKGKVFKFKVNATDENDARPKVVVTAKVGSAEAVTLYADSEGYYTFDTKDIEATADVTFTAIATDDYGNASSEKAKTIAVNVVSDTAVPIATDFNFDDTLVDGGALKSVYVGDEFTLPSVTFSDDSANLLVKVTVKTGSTVVEKFTYTSGSEKTIALGGEKFTPSRAGDYVVTYTATDVAGNKLIKSFVLAVEGQEDAIINLGSFESSYDYGTEIDLKNLTVTLQNDAGSQDVTDEYDFFTGYNGKEEDIADFIKNNKTNTIICQISGSYEPTLDESVIKAGENGSIKLNYWVVGGWTGDNFDRNFNPEPKTVSFTVSDTTKPTITVNEMEEVVAYDSTAVGDEANRVEIADFSAYDLAGIDNTSYKITAKYSSSSSDITIVKYDASVEEELNRINEGFYGYFKATKNGTVTVTYSVTDNNGNTATEPKTIYVGDTSKPEIKVSALQDAINKAGYKKGSTVKLDLTKLNVVDDKSNLTYDDVTVTVTCDGEDVEFTRSEDKKAVEFKAENYGEYVVSFSVTDEAGNVSETTQASFSLSQSSSTSGKTTTSSTTVWGTILIIVILIALGVIIFLFAKPSKTKTSVKVEKKDDDKKDKDDKIQV